MSDSERPVGATAELDVHTFTQATPGVVEGAVYTQDDRPDHVVTAKEVLAANKIVRCENRRRAWEIMKSQFMHSIRYYRMLCAKQTKARADRRCRRLVLTPALQGPIIPKAFQTRMYLMLVMGHATSLSFELGGRHRLISIWTNTLLRLQVLTAMGSAVHADHLLPPLKLPKVISKESPRAFDQVLETVDKGYIDLDVPPWQCLFASPLKTVPKVKVSCLNLDDVEGGRRRTFFFGRRLQQAKSLRRPSAFAVVSGKSKSFR
jgi:hypothetical protein